MESIDIVGLSRDVLGNLCAMDYEQKEGTSNGQLIFPMNMKSEGRISEQELRILFIDAFKENCKELFYSIETPTILKYYFGKLYEEINQMALGSLHC